MMENENVTRIIKVTDKISIHIKIEEQIDLATLHAESVLVNKIVKAMDSLDSIESRTNELLETKRNKRIILTPDEERRLLKDFKNSDDKNSLAKLYGFNTVNSLYARIYHIQNKNKKLKGEL